MTTNSIMMLADGYKLGHRQQYPPGTTKVFSNLTPRSSRAGDPHVVFAGFQAFLDKWMGVEFKKFFDAPRAIVIAEYEEMLASYLGPDNNVGSDHIGALHDLGYVPLEFRALPEGTLVPMGVPVITVTNTHDDFFWLVNYFETLLSTEMWLTCTSATTAYKYRKLLNDAAEKTGADMGMVQFQGHDFSMRGMEGVDAAERSGFGHLLSFAGTDTVPALGYTKRYYGDGLPSDYLIGGSVPACYDDKTEILTDRGFVLFKYLNDHDKVAEYKKDGTIEFIEPLEYFKDRYIGEMIHFVGGRYKYIDLMVTPNHKMVVGSKTGELSLVEAQANPYPDKTYVKVAGRAIGGDLKNLTDLDRLEIAFQADGSYAHQPHRYTGERSGTKPIRFNVKKPRKIERLRGILDRLGYEYTATESKNRSGYVEFWILCPEKLHKVFDWIPYERITSNWAIEFIEEASYWDGSRNNTSMQYSSTLEENAEALATVATLAGYKAHRSFYDDQRSNRQGQHMVSVSYKDEVGTSSLSSEVIDYDGYVYCVSVPSKMIVVRRQGTTAICGNTEHAVMMAGGADDEMATYDRLFDTYPTGILSVVSDTWDLWTVLTKHLPP